MPKSVDKVQFLNELIDVTKAIITIAENEFMPLTLEALNAKPSAKKWSALECIEHMNIADKHYYKTFERKLQAHKPEKTPTFKSGWFGAYFTKLMKPVKGEVKYKMGTIPLFKPSSALTKKVLEKFITDQYNLLQLLETAKRYNITSIRIKSALGSWLMFRMGDAFHFVVSHNQRHVIQAQNALFLNK